MLKAEIKWKLRDYLARLKARAEGDTTQIGEVTTQIEKDRLSLLEEISNNTWHSREIGVGDFVCVGDFVDEHDMSLLVKLMFDELLGS